MEEILIAHQRVDAVVIGAGAGGLCAAARLTHAGLHTIIVDDKSRVGGRASTEEIDGFTVNIGAIAIELGGVFEETFNTVGAPLDIRTPEPARAFLTYFTSKGAFKRFGFCPQGTIGVWNALASVIKRNGEIWLATPAVAIHTNDGRVEGVTVIR